MNEVSMDVLKSVEHGMERRGFSAFFGGDVRKKILKVLTNPQQPFIMELDKVNGNNSLHYFILIRSGDADNPVPAFMVTRDLAEGKQAELFINSGISFIKAANLIEGRAVQQNPNKIGECDPVWLRAEVDDKAGGFTRLKSVNAYQENGKAELKKLFSLIPHKIQLNIFTKELLVMKLVDGEMPMFDTGRFGKFYLSAEPEISSLSLWDKDKNLLLQDIRDENGRQQIFSPDRLNQKQDQQTKVKKGTKL